ncbi:DUF2325 domain-containing protein [Cytobacillus purgationiresistens]|uniref:DUF2325 domain-containing protein n=1 Tax=Cytobacillus purgationiresistens TaxID=863449 RepID=A0ABU0AJ03_9BACI|nr:DUF2325 domain-containing protein [Cytobacillus purgationiresistens]MDQ0271244.1 hypothetical protein [Cytobacillus purgationiresistens]
MKKPVLAIIGGNNESTYKKIGQKMGCQVLFHVGKKRNGAPKLEFKPLVKKADIVIVLKDCCGHEAMNVIKELCKETGKTVVFPDGYGASGPIKMGLAALTNKIAS